MLVVTLINEVRRLANLHPDNIYRKPGSGHCSYVEGICTNGAKGCLFGQALANLKIKINGKEGNIKTLALDLELIGTVDQINWCGLVQKNQDKGMTWKEAVETADWY